MGVGNGVLKLLHRDVAIEHGFWVEPLWAFHSLVLLERPRKQVLLCSAAALYVNQDCFCFFPWGLTGLLSLSWVCPGRWEHRAFYHTGPCWLVWSSYLSLSAVSRSWVPLMSSVKAIHSEYMASSYTWDCFAGPGFWNLPWVHLLHLGYFICTGEILVPSSKAVLGINKLMTH